MTLLSWLQGLRSSMPYLYPCRSNLLYITLQFKTDLDCPNYPLICCTFNSCAALTAGNFHFFALVAKHFPHCVAKIFTPNNCTPIVHSGIVQSNAESMMTKLEVGFLSHLLYKKIDGDSASLMVATGPKVLINTIIGLLFMKVTGMILDLINKIVECTYLDCLPFSVDFQCASNQTTYPSWTNRALHQPTMQHLHLSGFKKLLTLRLERYYDAKVQGGSMLVTKNPALHFGSRPAHVSLLGTLSIHARNCIPSRICRLGGFHLLL
jgi:hypothetical protein